jgi:Cu2+-exporting ATPase
MVGIGKGAEKNILVRDAEALEKAGAMKAIVLDKTGTITEGRPVVENVIWLPGADKELSSGILLSLERASEHPLGDAVTAYLSQTVAPAEISGVESITGKGITAISDGRKFFAGGSRLISENGIYTHPQIVEAASKWEDDARSVIFFADSEKVLAAIAVSDPIRDSSAATVEKLRAMGIEVYMLTGDNEKTAVSVARRTGITEFRSGMLPSGKADFVKALQAEGKVTGMVGDGINDSQALATADISIAMGKGSDIAIDAARMTIIGSDLSVIPEAVRLSKRTVRTIRQNLFWAFIYNVIGIPLAAGVLYPVNGFLLNPMIAGLAMALSSVSVVSNSLRLKLSK